MSAVFTPPTEGDRPSSTLVEQLIDIWTRTLRAPAIKADSDFFELGGDSLMAANLLLEIERETGMNIPITAIYDAPTVAGLADLIAGAAAPKFSPLVLLKPGEGETPFFIVHGIGGVVVELRALARKICIRGPVYGLQARGLDGAATPLDTVDDMAELYLEAIGRVQPTGPYWLCGYSFGGLVALEMARRLKERNQETALLILMDAYAHSATWPFASRIKMRSRRALRRIGEAARQPLGKAVPNLFRRAISPLSVLTVRRRGTRESRLRQLRQWLLDHNPNLPLPLLQVYEAGDAALSSYVPAFYPGMITFLKAARRTPEFPDDPQRIWRHLVGRMDICIVPGSHRTIVTENAAAAAAQITACIAAARLGRSVDSAAPAGAGVFEAARERRLKTRTK